MFTFLRPHPNKWTTSGINNILSTKQLLRLFGTIKRLVKENIYSDIVIGVDDENDPSSIKRLKSYRGILKYVQDDLGYIISPTEEELNKLSPKEREQINYIILQKDSITRVDSYLSMKEAKLNRHHN